MTNFQSRCRGGTCTRREMMLTALAVTASGSLGVPAPAEADDRPRQAKLLSDRGCGRATGYAEANKIVTAEGRTHVAWLDSPAEGFRVRMRTLDRGTGSWSPTFTIGDAHDNHGGPALTVDGDGFLHVVYFPHHHAMRYRQSKRPHDASEWGTESTFGENLTYPTLVCGRDNTLYLTARRSFPDRPWQVELWKRPPGGTWQRGPAILASRYPGYAHFQESLAWGPDHRTLHLCCRFHEHSDGQAYGRAQTVGYLFSPDAGQSWRRRDGVEVSLPATADSVEVLASGGVQHARILRAGALAVDRHGLPHVVYGVQEDGRARLLIALPHGPGTWQRRDLTPFLPDPWSSWNLVAPAGVTFSASGEMIVASQIQQTRAGESGWGHPTNEVVAFRSPDGDPDFAFAMVSRPDRERSRWLPNIERATGHHFVGEAPCVIYTDGQPGSRNTEILSNNVVFQVLD